MGFKLCTFNKESGTKIKKRIENTEVKSIVKNENLIRVCMEKEDGISNDDAYEIYKESGGKVNGICSRI